MLSDGVCENSNSSFSKLFVRCITRIVMTIAAIDIISPMNSTFVAVKSPSTLSAPVVVKAVMYPKKLFTKYNAHHQLIIAADCGIPNLSFQQAVANGKDHDLVRPE